MGKTEKPDKLYTYIMLGLSGMFMVCGTLLAAVGAWTLAGFASCAQTIVCDNDVLPPVISVGGGASALVCAGYFLRLCRWPVENHVADSQLRLITGVTLLVAGLALAGLDIQQHLANADSRLAYYAWVEKGQSTFALNLLADGLTLGVGAYVLRQCHQARRAARSSEGQGDDHG